MFQRQAEAGDSVHDGQIENQGRSPKGDETWENDEVAAKEELNIHSPAYHISYSGHQLDTRTERHIL